MTSREFGMTMTLCFVGAALLSVPCAVAADVAVPQRVTFYKDVLPAVQENCQDCHRPAGDNVMGMVAPMSFMTYAETRPWAKAIAKQVKARTMPPWHATHEFDGVFKNQRTLSDTQIAIFIKWSETGAARGRPQDAPGARSFPESEGWAMGKPDLVVPFPEPLFIQDSWEDQYQVVTNYITAEEMPEDQWIQSMEFRPGSEAVHHIVIFTSGQRESLGFGSQGMLGGMGPGTDHSVFPEGYGRLLEKESMLMFNMHYHKEPGPGTGLWDESEIGFRFQEKPVQHAVNWGAVGTMNFSIPPHESNWEVTAEETFAKDSTLLGLFPHMHLRGKAAKYTAYYPDGTEEVLLDVPQYDFNWQTNYVYKEPKQIPAGTRIKATLWFDNSEERAKLAGIDPSRTVRWGQPTTDEMMYGWIDYCETAPIDSETASSE